MPDIFAPSAGAVLSLTTTAQFIALDPPNSAAGDAGPVVKVYNAGSVALTVAFGSALTAAAGGTVATDADGTMDTTAIPIAPSEVAFLKRGRNSHMSLKTVSSTATAYLAVGS